MVLTSGNCGAIWFASALNLHPDIFAGCGIDHPIESLFRYNLKKDGAALLQASTDRHFRFGAVREVLQPVLDAQGLQRTYPPRDYTNLPAYVFDELEELPGSGRHTALGSVHAFTAVQFAEEYARNPHILGNRRVTVTNMIRHPVSRTESFIRAFIDHHLGTYKDAIDGYIAQNLGECLRLERTYGISMTEPRVRAALATYRIAKSVEWVADELRRFGDMVALKMEDLQTDGEYFASAVEVLTGGRIVPDASYLAEVHSVDSLGVGRRHVFDGTRPPGPRDQWDAWSAWERYEFLGCCHRCGLIPLYEAHGYDFSFLSAA